MRVVFFADADELDRRAGDFADGKRRAAAGVAVELGEDHARDTQPLVEFPRGAHGVLPDHGVGDEQHFGWGSVRASASESSFINSSSMCRRPAVSTRITSQAASLASRTAPRTISRGLLVPVPGQQRSARGLGDLRELLARGGAVDVRGNHDWPVAVLGEPFAHFAGGGGLAGALQSDDQPDRRRAGRELRLGFAAEQFGQFIANDFDDLLIGRKLEHYFRADGFGFDVLDQLVDDGEVDVAIEHGLADLAQCGFEVLVGEFPLAAEIFENAL